MCGNYSKAINWAIWWVNLQLSHVIGHYQLSQSHDQLKRNRIRPFSGKIGFFLCVRVKYSTFLKANLALFKSKFGLI